MTGRKIETLQEKPAGAAPAMKYARLAALFLALPCAACFPAGNEEAAKTQGIAKTPCYALYQCKGAPLAFTYTEELCAEAGGNSWRNWQGLCNGHNK